LFLFGKFHSHQSGERWTREIALYSASFQPKMVKHPHAPRSANPFDRESGELNTITDTPKR
jgi:hypothetical protein